MLSPDQKGAIAETAIVHAAVKLGIGVYRPVIEGLRYDLVFDLGSQLVRVQCKWAVRCGDVIIVRCYSSRRTRNGIVSRCYTPDEVDAFAAYNADLNRCYFLPLDRFTRRSCISLRLSRTRNNQQRGIVWAHDFELESLHSEVRHLGAIAQLGERLAGSQKGTGSSPVGSTDRRNAF